MVDDEKVDKKVDDEKVDEKVDKKVDENSATSLDEVLSVLNTVLSKIEVIENHLSTPDEVIVDEPDEVIEDVVEDDFIEDLDKIF